MSHSRWLPGLLLALVLVGCTGLVSLGHAAFYGLAAYTVYLVTPANVGRSILLTLPLAMLVAALAALLVGALSLRTRGFFFLMVTLAFGQMLFFLFHDTKLGGGTDGAYLARPLLAIADWQLPLTRRQRPYAVYYLALARKMYIERPARTERVPLSPSLAAAILIAVVGVVALGVYPKPVVMAALRVAAPLF